MFNDIHLSTLQTIGESGSSKAFFTKSFLYFSLSFASKVFLFDHFAVYL